jgi:hypothetical protein
MLEFFSFRVPQKNLMNAFQKAKVTTPNRVVHPSSDVTTQDLTVIANGQVSNFSSLTFSGVQVST